MWAFIIISMVVSTLWIPVLWFFFKNWRARKNPISLSICGVLFFVVYSDALVWVAKVSSSMMPLYIMQGTELLTIIFFYVSLRWARWKFGGDLGPERRAKG